MKKYMHYIALIKNYVLILKNCFQLSDTGTFLWDFVSKKLIQIETAVRKKTLPWSKCSKNGSNLKIE